MSKPSIHKPNPLGYSAPAIARMITGTATLEPANTQVGFEVVTKSRGTGGNPIGRVIDVLKDRDRPDARPPVSAFCKTCFEVWTRAGRPKLVTCKHRGVAALRRAGRWSVATGLTRAQMKTLKTLEARE